MPLVPEQVILKSLSVENVTDRYVGWLNDPEINQFLEIRHRLPICKNDVIEFIANCEKKHRHHWGIFVEDEHVGTISCSVYNHNYKWVDISILIGENKYRGVGLGRISLAGAVDYLFSVGQFRRIQAGSYENNIASIKLFRSLGFRKEAFFKESILYNGEYLDDIMFGLLKHEWDRKKNNISKAKVFRVSWEN
jgi:RimJ/RimL family protein N-acetyltransferase